jgi:transposase
MNPTPEELRASDVSYLPIVAAYVKRLGIVDEVNRLCPSSGEVSVGHIIAAMILDTLSGRTPLYKLERSFEHLDIPLLLGLEAPASKFNDDAVGRAMDAVFDAGTGLALTAAALNAVKEYDLQTRECHHDTTSITLCGDYDLYEQPDHGHPFVITHGYSKEHRPDLKQFVHSLLCVDCGIPVGCKSVSGNESDKTINRNLLKQVSRKMRELGEKDPVFIADSALVTEENLNLLADNDTGCLFITRLPRTYKECVTAVERCVEAGKWRDLGTISPQRVTSKRKPAHYRGVETTVELYGRQERALVVQSDAQDKRSVKKLERDMERDRSELSAVISEQDKMIYACRPDAERGLGLCPRGEFHRIVGEIQEVLHYPKGRPKRNEARIPSRIEYRLALRLEVDEEAVSRAKLQAGCFVLLTNVPQEGARGMGSLELLTAYKGQDTVERNFGFLKDEAIANSLFLKTPARLEVLGLVLVLSLMVWRLMERSMRISLKERGEEVEGWDKKPTSRPTSLMIATMFKSAVVIRMADRRFLANGLTATQRNYLDILGVSPCIFTDAPGPSESDAHFTVWEGRG